MKKLAVFLMMFLYVISVSGVTISRHFCRGKLSSVKITMGNETHTCKCGKKKMKKNCCKNQHLQVKVKGEHKAINQLEAFTDISKIIPAQTSIYKVPELYAAQLCISNYNKPPPRPHNSLLVLHSVFRI